MWKIGPYHVYVFFRILLSVVLSYVLFRFLTGESGYKNFGLLWILAYPLILMLLLLNLFLSFKKIPKSLRIYNFLLPLLLLATPFLSNNFEKGLLLEAHLKEERSSWNIKIFENRRYLIRRSNLGGFQDYEGTYSIKGDTLFLENFNCTQCNFNTEWIFAEKNLQQINSKSDNCYGCLDIKFKHEKVFQRLQ